MVGENFFETKIAECKKFDKIRAFDGTDRKWIYAKYKMTRQKRTKQSPEPQHETNIYQLMLLLNNLNFNWK
jgi:hypothetical protein